MPSKRMVPEQWIAELSDETVRLLALKDGVIAKLTEQRDRAMAVVRNAYRVIQHARAVPYRDDAQLRITATPMWEDFETSTLAALDTPSSPALPERRTE